MTDDHTQTRGAPASDCESQTAAWTLEKQAQFCEALAQCGVVVEAADAVGLSRRSAYAFRASSKGRAFAKVWDQARDQACRALLDEAVALAFDGHHIQQIENGAVVSEIRRNSPAQLLRTVERLRDPAVLGNPQVMAAADDFERCLDLLEAGEAFPAPLPRASMMGQALTIFYNRLHGLEPVPEDDGAAPPQSAPRPIDTGGHEDREDAPKPLSHRWNPKVQRRFCAALAKCGNVDKACRAVGRARSGAYALRRRPEGKAFAIAWDAALLVVSEEMMDMALELARDGSVETRHNHGKLIRIRRTRRVNVMVDTIARVSTLRAGPRRTPSGFATSLARLASGEAQADIEAGKDEQTRFAEEWARKLCAELLPREMLAGA